MFYTIDADVESPIMLIDKHIGESETDGPGIDGALFQRELLELDRKGKKSIQCWLNTPGGNIYQGYMILNSILNSKTPVDTINIGMVASMGFPVFMAGRKRIMMDYAIAMIHNPFDPAGGGDKKVLEAMTDSMVKMIASRSKLDEKKVRKMMDAETWLNAEECLEYGFCTEIEQSSQVNKKWMPAQAGNIQATWEQAKKVAASFIHQPTKKQVMSSPKICMKLGLNEAATDDNVVEAIKSIEGRAEKAEVRIIELEDKHKSEITRIQAKAAADIKAADEAKVAAETKATDLQASLTAKEKEYNDIKAKYDAAEKEKNDAIAAEKKTKAETMVASHVKTGRIKNDTAIITKWVAQAVDDFEGTKEMIEAIPLSKEAPKITNEAQKIEGIHATNAQMLALKAKMKREGRAIPEGA